LATGTVKWFNDDKGFGFITPDDQARTTSSTTPASTADGFRTLREGARVSFDSEAGPKGAQGRQRHRDLSG
jgi:CspA family cold shock protein